MRYAYDHKQHTIVFSMNLGERGKRDRDIKSRTDLFTDSPNRLIASIWSIRFSWPAFDFNYRFWLFEFFFSVSLKNVVDYFTRRCDIERATESNFRWKFVFVGNFALSESLLCFFLNSKYTFVKIQIELKLCLCMRVCALCSECGCVIFVISYVQKALSIKQSVGCYWYQWKIFLQFNLNWICSSKALFIVYYPLWKWSDFEVERCPQNNRLHVDLFTKSVDYFETILTSEATTFHKGLIRNFTFQYVILHFNQLIQSFTNIQNALFGFWKWFFYRNSGKSQKCAYDFF